ncbi:unnamed protein product [Ectocarpus sp. 12 AP-2014]
MSCRVIVLCRWHSSVGDVKKVVARDVICAPLSVRCSSRIAGVIYSAHVATAARIAKPVVVAVFLVLGWNWIMIIPGLFPAHRASSAIPTDVVRASCPLVHIIKNCRLRAQGDFFSQ